MNTRLLLKIVVLLSVGVFSISGQVLADTDKLIGSLTGLLGVNEEQATGGAGASPLLSDAPMPGPTPS